MVPSIGRSANIFKDIAHTGGRKLSLISHKNQELKSIKSIQSAVCSSHLIVEK